jgi:hypothetical protein
LNVAAKDTPAKLVGALLGALVALRVRNGQQKANILGNLIGALGGA